MTDLLRRSTVRSGTCELEFGGEESTAGPWCRITRHAADWDETQDKSIVINSALMREIHEWWMARYEIRPRRPAPGSVDALSALLINGKLDEILKRLDD